MQMVVVNPIVVVVSNQAGVIQFHFDVVEVDQIHHPVPPEVSTPLQVGY